LRRGPHGAHGAATKSSAPQLDPACDWQEKVRLDTRNVNKGITQHNHRLRLAPALIVFSSRSVLIDQCQGVGRGFRFFFSLVVSGFNMLPLFSTSPLSFLRTPSPTHTSSSSPFSRPLSQAIMMFPIHSLTPVGITHSSPSTPFQDYLHRNPVITQPSLSRLRERSLDLAGSAPSLPCRPLVDSLGCLLPHFRNPILGTQTQQAHTRKWHRINQESCLGWTRKANHVGKRSKGPSLQLDRHGSANAKHLL
jgi:hypothetical protein